jgi:hypothetical protein
MPGKLVVNVNADDDADERDFFQVRPQGKIARGAEIPHEGVESFNVRIVGEYACKLLQQRVFALVCEKTFGHYCLKFVWEFGQRQSGFAPASVEAACLFLIECYQFVRQQFLLPPPAIAEVELKATLNR